MLFSAAQLHSTVPNTCDVTRYSIDFRTVNLDDLINRCGAPNVDSACTGTTLRDYIRASDFTRLPDEVVALYLDGTEAGFTPSPRCMNTRLIRFGLQAGDRDPVNILCLGAHSGRY